MDIYYKSKQIERICNQSQVAIAKFGSVMAKKLQQRMVELKAADVLSDIGHLPPARLHELEGGRKGEFAVDLKQPFRLVFKPTEFRKGMTIEKAIVTAIIILEVIDYHGK